LLGAGNQGAPSCEVRLHEIAPGLGVVMTSAWHGLLDQRETLTAHQHKSDPTRTLPVLRRTDANPFSARAKNAGAIARSCALAVLLSTAFRPQQ